MKRGTWTSVLAVALAAALSTTANADTADIDQDGSGNVAGVEQSQATNSQVFLDQQGDNNETTFIQSGQGHAADVRIVGDDNNLGGSLDLIPSEGPVFLDLPDEGVWEALGELPDIPDDGPVGDILSAGAVQPGTVAQQGTGHSANVTVSNQNGSADGNLFAVLQAGTGNTASLTQAGSNNLAVQLQIGNNNKLTTRQNGSRNVARNYQFGDDNVLRQTQNGSEAATVVQVGDDNRLTQVPGVSAGPIEIKQYGGASATVGR